ncbi:MAG: hypothetical protein AB8B72_10540 [Crocinitomicaceae bacterium]
MKILITVLAIVSISHLSQAQDYREIGIRTFSFNSATFLFKKEKELGKFRRYSAFLSSQSTFGLLTTSQTRFGGSIGFEKRKELTEKVDFIRGFNPGFTFRIAASNGGVYPELGFSLGYIVGFQYHINKSFAVGAEMVPAFALGIQAIDNDYLLTNSINISQNAGLFFVYKFNKK